MSKVLHVCSTLSNSGPVRVIHDLLKCLAKSETNVSVLTLSSPTATSIDSRIKEMGIPVYTLGMSRTLSVLQGRKALRTFVRDHGIDLIHTHGFRADNLGVACSGYSRQLATVHCIPWEDYRMTYGRISGRLMAYCHLRALRAVDMVVAVSSAVAVQLARAEIPATIVRNGVDTDLYRPTFGIQEQASIRTRLRLPIAGKIFISVGHLTRLKNPLTIIHGVAQGGFHCPVSLVLLGDGELRSECAGLARDLGVKVFLPGWVDNVHEYLRAADILVSASQSEGMPLAVIEALSSGLPVCLSTIPSHEELIHLSGTAGQTFPCNDAIALARCLRELCTMDLSVVKSAALNIIRNACSLSVMAIRYQQLYEQAIFGKKTK